MKIPINAILYKLTLYFNKIHEELNPVEWNLLIEKLSIIKEMIAKGDDNNQIAGTLNGLINMLSQHEAIKNLLFKIEVKNVVRSAVSPLHQQPEKIAENLLCQRLDAFVIQAKKLEKARLKEKNVNYSK